jgi:hypothetical protein
LLAAGEVHHERRHVDRVVLAAEIGRMTQIADEVVEVVGIARVQVLIGDGGR